MSRIHTTAEDFSPSFPKTSSGLRLTNASTLVVLKHRTLTLGLLPEKKAPWPTFVFSYVICLFLVLFTGFWHLLWPDHISRLEHRIDLVFRQDVIAQPSIPKPAPVALPVPRVEPSIERPKLIVTKSTPPRKNQVPVPEVPKIPVTSSQLPKLSSLPPDMPKVIHTGSFASSETATAKSVNATVQTGGFGEPSGLPGTGKQGARLQVSSLGSFDLPQGLGKGSGTGGAKGVQGSVAAAGFGSGIAQPGPGSGQRKGQEVQSAGFAAQQVSTSANGKSGSSSQPVATVAVEILYKPKPTYTDEARKLKLEGEVLLEVLFRANGQLQVNRVLRGLGHGLDEAAVDAANKIRFKPAERSGSAVDSTVVVHVLFQLAS